MPPSYNGHSQRYSFSVHVHLDNLSDGAGVPADASVHVHALPGFGDLRGTERDADAVLLPPVQVRADPVDGHLYLRAAKAARGVRLAGLVRDPGGARDLQRVRVPTRAAQQAGHDYPLASGLPRVPRPPRLLRLAPGRTHQILRRPVRGLPPQGPRHQQR